LDKIKELKKYFGFCTQTVLNAKQKVRFTP